jgi:hypothetical protein
MQFATVVAAFAALCISVAFGKPIDAQDLTIRSTDSILSATITDLTLNGRNKASLLHSVSHQPSEANKDSDATTYLQGLGWSWRQRMENHPRDRLP